MKDTLKIVGRLLGFALGFALVVVGVGGCKYVLWRAEHPDAKTWTFFIPK